MPFMVRQEWRGGYIFPLFRRRCREQLAALKPDVEAFCISQTPIDTGALRSTITAFVPDDGVRFVLEAGGPAPKFGTYVVYAMFVHDGTDRTPARPFVTWTMNRFESEFRQACGRAWGLLR